MSHLTDLPPDRDMHPAHLLARQQRVERYAAGSAERRLIPRTVARYAGAFAGAATLLLGGTAAAAYVAWRPASVPVADQARCYSKASLAGDDDFFGTTVGQARSADGSIDVVDAVQVCSALWRQGVLRLGVKQVGGPGVDGADHPVPPLTACTLDNGIAAILPGDDQTCARLGLPRLSE